jgi:hypothetical protein
VLEGVSDEVRKQAHQDAWAARHRTLVHFLNVEINALLLGSWQHPFDDA